MRPVLFLRGVFVATLLLFAAPCDALPICSEVAAHLEDLILAKVVRTSPAMGNIFLSHPAAKEIVLLCGMPTVAANVVIDGAVTTDYLRLTQVVSAAVTGHNDKGLPKAVEACLKKSRKIGGESVEAATTHVSIDCTFASDGLGTVVTISPRRPD